MATLADLLANGYVLRWDPALAPGDRVMRHIFVSCALASWLNDWLPNVPASTRDQPRPISQADSLAYEWVIGARVVYPFDFRKLQERTSGVWELKQGVVRLIGFFAAPREFVAVAGAIKGMHVHDKPASSYDPFIALTAAFWTAFGLEPIRNFNRVYDLT